MRQHGSAERIGEGRKVMPAKLRNTIERQLRLGKIGWRKVSRRPVRTLPALGLMLLAHSSSRDSCRV